MKYHIKKAIESNPSDFSDILGKTVLVGLTYLSPEDKVIERKQFWGTVIESNERAIRIRQKNNDILTLPPDLSSTKAAPRGEYRLRTTGERIVDPDYLITWYIHTP